MEGVGIPRKKHISRLAVVSWERGDTTPNGRASKWGLSLLSLPWMERKSHPHGILRALPALLERARPGQSYPPPRYPWGKKMGVPYQFASLPPGYLLE